MPERLRAWTKMRFESHLIRTDRRSSQTSQLPENASLSQPNSCTANSANHTPKSNRRRILSTQNIWHS